MSEVTIRRLLVANRGEIARRVARTARQMGMTMGAVYADADADAPFVKEADFAVALGGRTAAETYLDVAKVVAAARRMGADAIHPGYGFLSESAAFARAVVDAGLVWVGPPPDVVEVMGDKLEAKRLMAAAGVPTLPSVEVADGAPVPADDIGFPVLVKAAAGGGGRGMRVVTGPAELADAVAAARREAASSFSDDRVFLERYVTAPRHIEVQILADQHGHVVHCFERECSIQRRHQKILEESPSPALTAEQRERIGAAAVTAAQAVGYASVGTVEFLFDGDRFWFLEVNTRLQVEHPVTELVTGLDLVREQLRVAMGEPLGFTQEDLRLSGHAIEARLYAEDPAREFLPATGTLVAWEPDTSAGTRVDSGVERGSVVDVQFDPLLAKFVAFAPTRTEAALALALSLERSRISGVVTNRDFLVAVLRDPAFLAGDTTTDFIERVDPPRSRTPSPDEVGRAAQAPARSRQWSYRQGAIVQRTIPTGWRNSRMPLEEVRFRHGEDEVVVRYQSCRDGSFVVESGGAQGQARVRSCDVDGIALEVDGNRWSLRTLRVGPRWWVHGPDGEVELTEVDRFPRRAPEPVAGGLAAPMPGAVLVVEVEAGQAVAAGQLLVVLEAMKMEHRIVAAEAGTVAEVRVGPGDQVEAGALLVVIEPAGKERS